jgi:hypothetical protein
LEPVARRENLGAARPAVPAPERLDVGEPPVSVDRVDELQDGDAEGVDAGLLGGRFRAAVRHLAREDHVRHERSQRRVGSVRAVVFFRGVVVQARQLLHPGIAYLHDGHQSAARENNRVRRVRLVRVEPIDEAQSLLVHGHVEHSNVERAGEGPDRRARPADEELVVEFLPPRDARRRLEEGFEPLEADAVDVDDGVHPGGIVFARRRRSGDSQSGEREHDENRHERTMM